MRTSVLAIVLCVFTMAAGAQCVGTQTVSATPHRTHTEPQPARGELIKTAGAQPQDEVTPVAAVRRNRHEDEGHGRHTGTAMLLAALALMSGIALRRYSTRDE